MITCNKCARINRVVQWICGLNGNERLIVPDIQTCENEINVWIHCVAKSFDIWFNRRPPTRSHMNANAVYWLLSIPANSNVFRSFSLFVSHCSCTVSCIAVHTRSSTKSSWSVCLWAVSISHQFHCKRSCVSWSRAANRTRSLLSLVQSPMIFVCWKYQNWSCALYVLPKRHAVASWRLAVKWSPSINWPFGHQPAKVHCCCKANVPPVWPTNISVKHLVYHTHTPDHTFDPRDANSNVLVVADVAVVTKSKWSFSSLFPSTPALLHIECEITTATTTYMAVSKRKQTTTPTILCVIICNVYEKYNKKQGIHLKK